MKTIDCLKLNYKNDLELAISLKKEMMGIENESDMPDLYFKEIFEKYPECSELVLINYTDNKMLSTWLGSFVSQGLTKIEIGGSCSYKVAELLEQVNNLSQEEFSEFLSKLMDRL